MTNTFPEAGLAFLRQLKKNNDREWFRERKEKYKELVEEPMKALVLEVAAGCRAKGLPLHAKEKSPVMRVYRDVRFGKDKTPFKTHVGADLRRSFADSQGLLYMHIDPKEPFVAAGVWQPERPLLHAWREAIVQHAERFAKLEASLTTHKLKFSGEYSLTKSPRGFEQYANEPFAQALKLTSFVVSQPLDVQQVTAPDFAKTLVKFALAAKPLMEFAWMVEESSPQLKRKKIREEELV